MLVAFHPLRHLSVSWLGHISSLWRPQYAEKLSTAKSNADFPASTGRWGVHGVNILAYLLLPFLGLSSRFFILLPVKFVEPLLGDSLTHGLFLVCLSIVAAFLPLLSDEKSLGRIPNLNPNPNSDPNPNTERIGPEELSYRHHLMKHASLFGASLALALSFEVALIRAPAALIAKLHPTVVPLWILSIIYASGAYAYDASHRELQLIRTLSSATKESFQVAKDAKDALTFQAEEGFGQAGRLWERCKRINIRFLKDSLMTQMGSVLAKNF